MIGSSWHPEVSLLLFTLAEGSQEDPVGAGRLGWVPQFMPHSFQTRNWSLLKNGIAAPTMGSRPESRGSCRVRGAAQGPNHLASAPHSKPDSHQGAPLLEPAFLARESHAAQSSDLSSGHDLGPSVVLDIQGKGKCEPLPGKPPHPKVHLSLSLVMRVVRAPWAPEFGP